MSFFRFILYSFISNILFMLFLFFIYLVYRFFQKKNEDSIFSNDFFEDSEKSILDVKLNKESDNNDKTIQTYF